MTRRRAASCSVLVPVRLGAGGYFARVLRRALDAWRDVDAAGMELELVLCCDGPDARAGDAVRRSRCPFPVRVLHQEPRGQSAATNRAARAARGELLLFSAQDVVPTPGIVREHAHAGAGHGDVVLGRLEYPAELRVSPFMHFLVNGGPQFAFDRLEDGAAVPPQCLYAPNFSMARAGFLELGGFREDLPYGCQDSELGIRLALAGQRIVYRASALGRHWHPQTLAGFAGRQRAAGRATVRLAELHPRHRGLGWLREKVLEYAVAAAPHVEAYARRAAEIERDGRLWRARVTQSPVGPYEQDALFFLYDRVTKFHFYDGVREALEQREPGWLARAFAPWRLAVSEPPVELFPAAAPARREHLAGCEGAVA